MGPEPRIITRWMSGLRGMPTSGRGRAGAQDRGRMMAGAGGMSSNRLGHARIPGPLLLPDSASSGPQFELANPTLGMRACGLRCVPPKGTHAAPPGLWERTSRGRDELPRAPPPPVPVQRRAHGTRIRPPAARTARRVTLQRRGSCRGRHQASDPRRPRRPGGTVRSPLTRLPGRGHCPIWPRAARMASSFPEAASAVACSGEAW